MSKSIKKNKKLSHSGRMVLWGIMAVIALLALLTVVAAINANTLHVRKARVILPDLPASFEGRTLLYASDIDLCDPCPLPPEPLSHLPPHPTLLDCYRAPV